MLTNIILLKAPQMYFNIFILPLIIYPSKTNGNALDHYCNLPCKSLGGLKNIICERGTCKLDPKKCGKTGKIQKFLGDKIEWVVDEHNKYRQKIANGEDTRNGNGKAANMLVMSYHSELAFTAQCLANYCLYEHKCGRTTGWSYVGQNLLTKWSSRKAPSLSKKMIAETVYEWYIELLDGDESVIDHFHLTANQTAHFTQVIWAKTYFVGCGASNYNKRIFIVCNYAPGGNILGTGVYIRGEPCSKCPNDTKCSIEYPGLCGKKKHDFSFKLPKEIPGADDDDGGSMLGSEWMCVVYTVVIVIKANCV